MKSAMLAILLLLLAGCEEAAFTLAVHNQGSQPIVLEVNYLRTEKEEDSDGNTEYIHIPVREEFRLVQGEIRRFDFPTPFLDVRITQPPGNWVLYEEALTSGDFSREHGTVEIAVHPY